MTSEPVHSGEGTRWHRLLASLVVGACRYPRLVLTFALVLCAISIYAASTKLEYHTERSDLISPRKDYHQRWRQYLAEFGEDDDIVVVVQAIGQADHDQMVKAIEALASRLAEQPTLFDRLFYKADLRRLHNRALLLAPIAQIEQIQASLQSMRMLLDLGPIGWQSLTLLSLFREANARLMTVSADHPLKEADEQFLTQLQAIARSAAATLDNPVKYRNPWSSLMAQKPEQKDLLAEAQYFFSGDGSLAFLLVRPVKQPGSFTAARESVEAARRILEYTRSSFPDLDFGLTGLPVLENDEMVAAERDTHTASWLAIAGVTILFFIVYRGLRLRDLGARGLKQRSPCASPFRSLTCAFLSCLHYPLLTVTTLLIGTSWALGWMTFTVGHVNILSATFAVMLIGMGDYGVLWVMRYEQERRQGATVERALKQTARCVGCGTLTAALTTALAFYAAMLADFRAVAELGWIAGSGVLLCAVACFTLLPALLALTDRRGIADCGLRIADSFEQSGICNPQSATQGVWLPRLLGTHRAGWVVGTGLAVTAVLGFFAWRVRYDHNLLHLQAQNLDSVKWELTLIGHTAGASWHAQSYTATQAEALVLKERFEQLPEVSQVVEVASLVPDDQDKKIELLRDIQDRLRLLPEPDACVPRDKPDAKRLKFEVSWLIGTCNALLGQKENNGRFLCRDLSFAALRDDLKQLYARLSDSASGAFASARLQAFEEAMAADLAADLRRLRDVATPEPITLNDLPTPLRERYVGRSGKWLLQVFGKDSLWDFQPLEHFVQQIQQVDPQATGKPFATVEGLRAMKEGFQWAGVYAFGAIVLVLVWDFRCAKRMLLALTPLAMGIVMALGIMGLFGVPLNPANLIALPLVLGVGVDNGVHLLHDFLSSKAEGRGQLSHAIGRGVLVKALTTMIGFGALMISRQRGLSGLGFSLTLGVACCMISALVFLPAVLRALGEKRVEVSGGETDSGHIATMTFRRAA
jgi:hopanoid biosynthesis associated RND transporter like protein HpnN